MFLILIIFIRNQRLTEVSFIRNLLNERIIYKYIKLRVKGLTIKKGRVAHLCRYKSKIKYGDHQKNDYKTF